MPSKRKGRSSLSSVSKRAKATKKKRAAKPRKNAALVGNPPIWRDLWEEVVPGVGAYAITRVAGRCAYKLGKRKSMRFAKHIGPWTSVGVALATWAGLHFFASKETQDKYHTPVIVGSFLAAFQGLAQTYMPQWGWMLNDYHLDDAGRGAPQPLVEPGAPQNGNGQLSPQGQYHEANALEDDLGDVLNDGETENDFRTGIFA
jgi:hypothetical protein